MNQPSSSRRVAIVTCASRGIGAACARTLAAEGCHLALLARHADIHDIALGPGFSSCIC